MKKIYQQQEGFGLIEVIVGISMLLITAVAALSLSQTVIRTESFNEKRVMAYNLAQQVMEETRRSRDSSWDDLKSNTRWEDGSIDETEMLLGQQSGGVEDGYSYECKPEAEELKCVIKNEEFTVSRTVDPISDFKDLNGIENSLRGSDIDEDLARKVVVVVKWDERGAERTIDLTTVLTDWKSY